MDIDRIQKVNLLANNLMKQGLASDKDDAIRQAERIYDVQTPNRVEVQEETAVPRQDGITEDKLHEILEKNTQFLVKTIRDFSRRLDEMEQKLGARSRIQVEPLSQPAPPVAAPVAPPSRPAAPVAPPSRPAQPAASNPRSGNYNDEDVSIEKFFYMGSK